MLVKVPSSRHPNSTCCTWPRLWGRVTMSSDRVGTHWTGRPVRSAQAPTTTYSECRPALPPNPPPTCGVTTRTFSCSRLSAEQNWPWTRCGIWFDTHSVTRPVSGVDLGRGAVRLHRNDRHALVDVGAAHHVLVAELDRRVVDEDLRLVRFVGVEDERGAVAERLLGGDHRVERLDVGPDGLRRVDTGGKRLGEHDRERLADETHPIDRQRRPLEIAVDGSESMVRGHIEIGGRQDGDHAGHVDGVVDVDVAEHPVGDLGAHEDGVQATFEWEVGEVSCGADEQGRVFGARHAGAEDRAGAGCGFGDRHDRRP